LSAAIDLANASVPVHSHVGTVDEHAVSLLGDVVEHVRHGGDTAKAKARQSSQIVIVVKLVAEFVFEVAIDVVAAKGGSEQGAGRYESRVTEKVFQLEGEGVRPRWPVSGSSRTRRLLWRCGRRRS